MDDSFEMSTDAFRDSHPAKRRKLTTYTSKRTTPKSNPNSIRSSTIERRSNGSKQSQHTSQSPISSESPVRSPSVFERVSSAVSGIGRRLFETNAPADTIGSNDRRHSNINGEPPVSTLTNKGVEISADYNASEDEQDELATEELVGTPVKVRTASNVDGRLIWSDPSKDQDHDQGTPPTTRSSGRQRRKPRRYSDDLVKPTTTKPTQQKQPELKGILTPSKKKRGRKSKASAKSVVFQGEVPDSGLEFEDVSLNDQAKQQSSTEPILEGNIFSNEHDHSSGSLDIIEVQPPATLEDLEPGSDPSLERPENPPLETDSKIENLRSVILSRLTHRSLSPIVGLSTEYQKVLALLSQTVTAGEGNSMLILGSRGVGKTLLVETALAELQLEHANAYHTIYLNGLLQTDDKLALKEIWRQLGREMDIDEDENQVGSYADTLSSLLALLSHPEELAGIDGDRPMMNGPGLTAKSIVFVMDEFDLFASRPRQTLLYNLFDIAQARKAPIAVLGLSTRLDVIESLEKRVKSRFSQRYVFVPAAKSLDVFTEICKASMTVSSLDKTPSDVELDPAVTKRWNEWVDELFTKDEAMARHLSSIFTASKCVPDFHRSCLIPVSTLHSLDKDALPKGSDFLMGGIALSPPDNILSELPALTHLQLALLVCSARFDAIYASSTSSLDSIAVNFESVYAEYVRLSSNARIASSASGSLVASGTTRIWGKGTAEGAWEELIEKALLTEVTSRNSEKSVRVEVSLEEIIPGVEVGGGRVSDEVRKWCKDI